MRRFDTVGYEGGLQQAKMQSGLGKKGILNGCAGGGLGGAGCLGS